MKLKPIHPSSQFLILVLAGLILVLMIQLSHAQTTTIARVQPNFSESLPNSISSSITPKESLGEMIRSKTSLSYYQQFLGPTAKGDARETFNPFLESRAPVQSFHAFNLRYKFNPDWALGASLSNVHGYSDEVKTKFGTIKPNTEWFNARAYVSIPALKTKAGRLFTTLSYEAPTSVVSRNDDMLYGLVLSNSFTFNLPSNKWEMGLLGQVYRAYFENNVKKTPSIFGGDPFLTPMQTVIVSGGPFVNYRFNDKWMINTTVTFDWDQRGEQTSTTEFNNNLDHRARMSLNYYPAIKYLSSVGIFTQGPLKFRPESTAFGFDFAVRF